MEIKEFLDATSLIMRFLSCLLFVLWRIKKEKQFKFQTLDKKKNLNSFYKYFFRSYNIFILLLTKKL